LGNAKIHRTTGAGTWELPFFSPLSKDRNLEIDISLLSVLTKPSYYIVVGSYIPMCGGNPFSFIQPVYLT
jgi:hypothetical protein